MKYIFVLLVLFFSGCSLKPVYNAIDETKYEMATDFDDMTNTLISDIDDKLNELRDVEVGPLVITDFVNINYLNNKSNLGFVLGSELKSSLNEYYPDMKIKEVILGKDIKLGSNGTRILTRNPNEIKSDVAKDIRFILVGKYAITAKKLIVFLDLVDYLDGTVIASTSTSATITKEILMLEGKKEGFDGRVIIPPFIL